MTAENRQGQGLTYVMPEQGGPSCHHDFEGRDASRMAREARQGSPVPTAAGEDVEKKLREYKLLLWNAHVSPIDIHTRVNALRASLVGAPMEARQPVRIGE